MPQYSVTVPFNEGDVVWVVPEAPKNPVRQGTITAVDVETTPGATGSSITIIYFIINYLPSWFTSTVTTTTTIRNALAPRPSPHTTRIKSTQVYGTLTAALAAYDTFLTGIANL